MNVQKLNIILEVLKYGSMTKAAEKLGKSQSAVANKLRLLRLSPAVQQAVTESRLPERLARGLLTLPDEDLQLRAVRHLSEKLFHEKSSAKSIDVYIFIL